MRSEEARQKELQQIRAYKDLVDLVNTKVGPVLTTIRPIPD